MVEKRVGVSGLGVEAVGAGWWGISQCDGWHHHTLHAARHIAAAAFTVRDISRANGNSRHITGATYATRQQPMTQQIHRRHVDDTRTLLYATLVQPNASGVDTAVNLTGLTVKFKMVDAADGTVVIAETATGVTVETAASGTVKYDFSAAGVNVAGVFHAWFVVYDGIESDHFPVRRQGLKVMIDSDTQTAEEAYEAALEA